LSGPINAGPLYAALLNIMHEKLFDELLDASLGGWAGERQKIKYRDLIDREWRTTGDKSEIRR